ncbi:MAG: hypothetical protein ASARMPRED_007045 [Alectoria sarmentosa]|nr:MAG: hypothetical protein ASARMPRED_007045 [Alectoria sarmentosa]
MAATTTQTTRESVSALVNVRPQLERTKEEYRNSFGTLVGTVGLYKLWNIVNEVSNIFNSVLHPQLRDQLNEKRSSIRPPRRYRGPREPSNALRCYMVGLTQDRASPHVAILCKEKWFRTQARHIILEAGIIQDTGWVGCIRLPYEIRQNGDTSPKPKNTAEIQPFQESSSSMRDQHTVAILNFPKNTEIPCGLRIAISGIDGYVCMATIGGIIEINETLFGLSVSHAFSAQIPSYDDTTSELESDTESNFLDREDLDPFVRATDSSELLGVMEQHSDIPGASESSDESSQTSKAEDIGFSLKLDNDAKEQHSDIPGASESSDESSQTRASESSDESTQTSEAEDIDFSLEFDHDVNEPSMGQRLESELARWSLGSRETFGNEAAYEHEWALISMENDHISTEYDRLANFARSSLGERFRVTSLATKMAPVGTRLLLTTPRGGITAMAIGSESSVQLSSCKKYFSLWTVQLDRAEDGDCGSWIVDQSTGELFGMLVATCEAVSEAYILPMKDVFTDIEKVSGRSVKLPALKPVSEKKELVAASSKDSRQTKDSTFASLRKSDPLYPPLPADSIRILTLLPGKPESTIRCELSIRSLYDSRDYEVLSYALERRKSESFINVNGYTIRVNPYLESSIESLRYADRPRYLWVDDLCVNQKDIEERNSHVALVASIVTRASGVCIWLGKRDEYCHWAFSSYKSILDADNFDDSGDRKLMGQVADVLSGLVRTAWFHPGNVQAICLARYATIYCGQDSMPWKAFAEVVALLATHHYPLSEPARFLRRPNWLYERDVSDDLQTLFQFVNAVDELIRWLDDGQIERRYSLEALVTQFSWTIPTNHHDAIYSMLSLARDVSPSPKSSTTSIAKTFVDQSSPSLQAVNQLERRTMIVDYAQPFEHACKDFVQIAIQNSQSLDILCRPWAPQFDRLPSWVPEKSKAVMVMDRDNTMQSVNGDIFASALAGPVRSPIYNASKLKRPNFRMSDSSIGAPRMSVEGFTLDVIQAKQTPALMGNIPPGWIDFLGWKDIKGPPPDKAWRTLVGDRKGGVVPPPTAFYRRACERTFQRVEPGQGFDTGEAAGLRDPITGKFVRRVKTVVWGRRLIRTEKHDLVGLAPGATKKRDVVAILYGLSVPVVLRQVQDAAEGDNVYTLVGECFIYGMMDGEALDFKEAQAIQDQTFVLE